MLDTATPASVPWTRDEICQQPDTLTATCALIDGRRAEIRAFLEPLLRRDGQRIVLTGAGTSAFIGESLAPWLSCELGRSIEAIATTDIVSAPSLHLRRDAPTLLVSFGRSGSSPESVATAALADDVVDEAHHLVITCNAQGDLAQRTGPRTLVLVLPDETHDRGFAMTSSFTAMMMAAMLSLGDASCGAGRGGAIADAVRRTVELADSVAKRLAAKDFERIVFLGSGVFKGLAREAALKLMELSDGRIVTAFDTALGFRHGPKTIINPRTLAILFVANDPLTRRYDLDILAELRGEGRCGEVVAVTAQPIDGGALVVPGMTSAPDVDLLFPFIVPAQLLGLHVAQRLGIDPDLPNASGTVNRVVQGVRIHAIPEA